MQNDISVVITAGSTAEGLKKVLWGYNTQTYRNFEMVIAGNTEGLDEVREELFFPVIIAGASGNGTVLENALKSCTTAYVVLADGNAIPRQDFVEQHIKYREEGYYLTGNAVEVPQQDFNSFTREAIYSGSCFKRQGISNRSGLLGSIMNRLVPPDSDWNGQNTSAWKQDLGSNGPVKGIKPRQIKYSTVCLMAKK